MKKFLALMAISVLLVVTYSVPMMFLDKVDADKVYYYTNGNVTGEERYMFDNIYMTECDYEDRGLVEKSLTNIVGVTYTLNGDYEKYLDIIERHQVAVLANEVVDGIHIVYGFSEQCGQPRMVDGKAVNIQLAIHNNIITVGTPIIMGSY